MAEEAYGGVGIKSNYKLGQTQAPKGDVSLLHDTSGVRLNCLDLDPNPSS
jgi:hypothetical protein